MIDITVKSSGWPRKRDLDDLAEAQVREISRKIFEAAVRLSPVYTGSFRASWRIAFNRPDISVTLPSGIGPVLPGATFRWPRGFKLGDNVIISNSLPYADRIEFGWSSQAPFGVARLAKAEATYL